jgi:hypothetical protein
MIDLALNNIYLLGAALVIGVVTGRWAFSSSKAKTLDKKQEDDSKP